MAQTLMLGNGKIAKLPGAYATLKAEITSPTPMASYNNVLLIDAGAGAGFTSVPGVIKRWSKCKKEILLLVMKSLQIIILKVVLYHL